MIPCKKTQPPEDGRYIAQNSNGYMDALDYTNGKWNTYYDYQGTYIDRYELTNIVAWIWLPEPWRDEDDIQNA